MFSGEYPWINAMFHPNFKLAKKSLINLVKFFLKKIENFRFFFGYACLPEGHERDER